MCPSPKLQLLQRMKALNLTGTYKIADKIIAELVARIEKLNPDFIKGFYILVQYL